MRFAGKRKYYTRENVKQLRENLHKTKPKRTGIPADYMPFILGDLKAAGHMRVVGYESMETIKEEVTNGIPNAFIQKKNILKFNSGHLSDVNESPHLRGYLQSASDADKHQYQIRGWFNDDGTIRIELTTPFKK